MGIRDMRMLLPALIQKYDMTILLSSHILNEIEHIADTIGVIEKGHLIEEVDLKSIKMHYPDGLEKYFFNVLKKGIRV